MLEEDTQSIASALRNAILNLGKIPDIVYQDRVSEIVEFKSFKKKDVKEIITQLSEVEMTECAISFIYAKSNRFRQIVRLINKAEQIAQANDLSTVDEITLDR